MKKLFISFSLIVAVAASFAQDVPQRIRRADEKFTLLGFSEAVELYEKAYADKQGDQIYLTLKIANCYRLMGEDKLAEAWFDKANKVNAIGTYNYLNYAQVLASNEKYGEAEKWYTKFNEAFPNDGRGKLGIEACQNAKSLNNRIPVLEISRTNFNSAYSDFGPSITPEGLVFASNRTSLLNVGFKDKWTGANYLDLYTAKNDGQGSYNSPGLLKGSANSTYHESNLVYSPTGNIKMFTRSQFNPNFFGGHIIKSTIDNVVKLKLMYATKGANGKWSAEMEFPFNNENVNYAHPAFSADGKTVYFSSDRIGGFGGTDIWSCDLNADGSFTPPVNLGAGVNTEGAEMFPFVDKEGTLFFASNGLAGLGGLDIFRAAKDEENGTYQGASNMGVPINSSNDDFGLVSEGNLISGYFSSNRPGGSGSDDIYGFKIKGNFFQFQVIDATTNKPVYGSTVQEGKSQFAKSNIYGIAAGPMELGKEYNFEVSAPGYKTSVVAIDNRNWPIGSTQYQTIYLECDNENFVKGIVYEKNSKFPIPRATVTLVNRATGKETLYVTDASGIFRYPICPDGDYVLKGEKEGYNDTAFAVNAAGLKKGAIVEQNIVMTGPGINSMEFYSIYFDFDRFLIRPSASADLEVMYQILVMSKDLKVEIAAHTDSRGSNEYNDRLSNRRAEAVVKYLTKRGISPSRMISKGYGENELKNRCKDGVPCSDEEHQLNRRVEFRLLTKQKEVVGKSLDKPIDEIMN